MKNLLGHFHRNSKTKGQKQPAAVVPTTLSSQSSTCTTAGAGAAGTGEVATASSGFNSNLPSVPTSPAFNGIISSSGSPRTSESMSTIATTHDESSAAVDVNLHKSVTAETTRDRDSTIPSAGVARQNENGHGINGLGMTFSDDVEQDDEGLQDLEVPDDEETLQESAGIDFNQLPESHHERIEMVEDILKDSILEEDHSYYLVSATWWDHFFDDPNTYDPPSSRTPGEPEEKVGAVPPIEYAENTDDEGRVIPAKVFVLFRHWYGTTKPIRRHKAIEVGDENEPVLVLETFRPTLYLYPLGNVDGFKQIKVMEDMSLSTTIDSIIKDLNLRDVRLWQMTKNVPPSLPLTISDFRKHSAANLLENDKRLYHYVSSPDEHIAVEQKSIIGWMSRSSTIVKTHITPGTSGLANLGNSCYMNSALQCLLHIEELAAYFISKAYEKDLNRSNPIGYKGNVALEFAKLVENTFISKNTAYSPREFKTTIGRYGNAFAGFMQQDSQEFLAFLLDGLHEDLNKIINKPVTEWPEINDEQASNPEAIERLAEECWRLHKLRNESSIMDLFCGLYRSTLQCPECTKVSITFDPFMDLTLPLPNDNLWQKEIEILPKAGHLKRLEIGIDRHSTIRQLKDYVASKIGLDNSMAFISSEIYNNRFYKHNENWALISESISADDHIIVYELDRVPEKEDDEDLDKPVDDRVFAVPVFHRVTGECKGDELHGGDFFGTPFFITLTNNEARDSELIMKKIMQRFPGDDEPKLNYVEHKRLKEDPMTGWNISQNLVKSFNQRDEGYVNEEYHTPPESVKGTSEFIKAPSVPNGNNKSQSTSTDSLQDNSVNGTKHVNGDDSLKLNKPESNESEQNLVSLTDDKALYLATDSKACETSPVGSGQYVYRGEGIVCDWDEQHAKQEIVNLENPELQEMMQDREDMKTKGITLDDCLDLFSKAELLSKDDLWYCSKCKVLRQATKTIDLWKIPDIFTIHVKRFASFRSFRDKLDDTVQFPLEGLDMTKRVACSDGRTLIYDLIAVDNHFGGLGGGHYTAYGKNFFDKRWYYFDDAHVKETDPENCVSGAAYLLFYRRRSDVPLGNDELKAAVSASRKRLEEAVAVDTSSSKSIAESASSTRSSVLLASSFPSQISLTQLNNSFDSSPASDKLLSRRGTGTSMSSLSARARQGVYQGRPQRAVMTLGSDCDEED